MQEECSLDGVQQQRRQRNHARRVLQEAVLYFRGVVVGCDTPCAPQTSINPSVALAGTSSFLVAFGPFQSNPSTPLADVVVLNEK